MSKGVSRAEQLSILFELSQAFSAQIELDELLPSIIARTKEVLEAESCALLLLDEEHQELFFPVTSDVNTEIEERFKTIRFPADRGIAGWVLQQGVPTIVPDVSQDERWYGGVDMQSGMHTRDLLCAPLRTQRGIIGVIQLRNKLTGTFTEDDLAFLDVLTGPVAIALENATLYQDVRKSEIQLKRELATMRAVAELGQRALAGVDTSVLIEQVVSMIAGILDVEYSEIWEWLPGKETLLLRGGTGWREELVGHVMIHTIADPYIQYTLKSMEPVFVEDLQSETRFSGSPLLREHGVISGLRLVMYGTHGPFGIMGAHSTRRRRFTSGDRHFLQAVANILTQAIERKQAEQALQESKHHLEVALAQLKATQHHVLQQERLRALGQMAGGVAHDFNNALLPVIGYSDLLLTRPEVLNNAEQTKRYLQLIYTGAKDAANVVSRLREFYRQREEDEVFQPVDLSQLVEQALMLTQPKWKEQAQASGLHIQVQTGLQPNLLIAGNAAALREVLTNLIFNAVDAMPDGGTLTLSTRLEGDQVVLEVQDTGMGMTEEVRQRCLEPFFTTKGELGTGLGLAMVYGIIKRHEGIIDIQSQVGKGTTFIIHLPAMTAEKPQREEGIPLAKSCPNPLRILIVEDETAVREVIAEYLMVDGHTVEEAVHGREGLEKFQQGIFDLVIVDRAMPEMNGDQLAAAIKKTSPSTPVILLTGFGDMMQAPDEKPAGVDLIVSKPITLEDLRKALAHYSPGN